MKKNHEFKKSSKILKTIQYSQNGKRTRNKKVPKASKIYKIIKK